MGIIPRGTPLKPQSSVQHLLNRLEWGEPGLTIIDARDRDQFNYQHISGAVSMPMEDDLVARAETAVEKSRDIYVYGENDQETARAAGMMRSAGFVNTSELKGGIDAWKAVAGPIDDGASYAAGDIPEPKLAIPFMAEQAKHKG